MTLGATTSNNQVITMLSDLNVPSHLFLKTILIYGYYYYSSFTSAKVQA